MKHNQLPFFIFIGLLTVLTVAQAEEEKKIYKYTDENGVTHYSETKPNDNYQEADLPALSIVPSVPVKNNTTTSQVKKEETKEASVVKKFSIIAPVNEQNLWGTGGKLSAQVEPLTAAQKEVYQIQFIVDGKKRKPANNSTQVFGDIYRGEHKVKALLVNRFTKRVIKETETVTFFMHQNSKK